MTNAGTVAAGLRLNRVTKLPPTGAGDRNVTLPVELAPPSTELGLTETSLTSTVAKYGLVAAKILPSGVSYTISLRSGETASEITMGMNPSISIGYSLSNP